MSETLQHLVLVRHGEGEGDVRRAAWKRGEEFVAGKLPEEEELTARGAEQCRRAGAWMMKNIIKKYELPGFDACLVSSALRSEQSAMALELEMAVWQEDHCLDERYRGQVRGLRSDQHKQLYPESFKQMRANPLQWVPPEGEAIAPDVVDRSLRFLANIEGARAVVAETHRDWMWAAMQPLEGLSDAELARVDTDQIHNAQIFHYTSIDPATGGQAPELKWKYSVDPMRPETSTGWQALPRPYILPVFAGDLRI